MSNQNSVRVHRNRQNGYEPCLCGNKKYIEMYEFVYRAMLRTKGG